MAQDGPVDARDHTSNDHPRSIRHDQRRVEEPRKGHVMSYLLRTPVILCCLMLGTLYYVPASATAQVTTPSPALSRVTMVSPFGTATVSGEGFTPGGLVRLVIHDLSGIGPDVDVWLVSTAGAIDITFPYLTNATYGPNGSQDPAQGYVPATFADRLLVTEVFGPNGSQDPAQGYASSSMSWRGACPNLLVNGWDSRTDTWSNALEVQFASC